MVSLDWNTVLEKSARLFYIIHPNTTFEKVEDIPSPNFIDQAIPYFLTLIVIEYIIQCIKGKARTRLNDGIGSLSAGLMMILKDLIVRGSEGWAYVYLYENYRMFELPWDSPVTWYVAAILGDLAYYWAHRAGHEINLFWASHQVHHSSEDYNLTTALRQSAFQSWFTWIFYLPTAFFLPPPLFLIHQQFNTLYQFWIHTEVIDNLGPLEYILNTPRHHRVHHGCNRYCLDKNYAGVLIIWDRIFGTFQDELPGTLTYGLVDEVNSFNPIWLQFFSFGKVWQKAQTCSTVSDKVSAAVKGPGWFPGLPRLGDDSFVAEFPNRPRYDPKIPRWQSLYAFLHFILTIIILEIFRLHASSLNQTNVIIFVGVMIYTLTSLGFLIEGRQIGRITEIIRCFASVWFLKYLITNSIMIKDYETIMPFLLGFFSVSLFSFLLFEISQFVKGESKLILKKDE